MVLYGQHVEEQRYFVTRGRHYVNEAITGAGIVTRVTRRHNAPVVTAECTIAVWKGGGAIYISKKILQCVGEKIISLKLVHTAYIKSQMHIFVIFSIIKHKNRQIKW